MVETKPHYTEVWNLSDIQHLAYPNEVHNEDGYVYIGRGDGGDTYMATNVMPGVLGWLGKSFRWLIEHHEISRTEMVVRSDEVL